MKRKKIKTEAQAKEFVAESLAEHFERCSKVLDESFVGEVSLYVIASLFCQYEGNKKLEKMFEEVKFNNENEPDDSPEFGSKNRYH